jgi:hypothetical protein
MAVEESLEDQGTIKMQVVSILTNVLSNRIDLFVGHFSDINKIILSYGWLYPTKSLHRITFSNDPLRFLSGIHYAEVLWR